jgi:hypothetical protein
MAAVASSMVAVNAPGDAEQKERTPLRGAADATVGTEQSFE